MALLNSSESQLYCDPSFYLPEDKWKQWYGAAGAATELRYATAYCIDALFSANQTFFHAEDPVNPHKCPDGYQMITCVQNKIGAGLKASFASAQVLLGLTPTLLSFLAPTIGEISMLSASRPILSFLLGVGSPGIFSIRALEYDDPLGALIRRIGAKADPLRRKHRRRDNRVPMITRHANGPTLGDKFISVLEYLLALAGVGNVITNGLQLGVRTIVVWKVSADYMVLLWSTLAAVVHLTAAATWYYSRTMRTLRHAERGTDEAFAGHMPRALRRFTHSVVREATICAAHQRRGYIDHDCSEGILVQFFNRAANFMAFLLVIFGTATMSSLLFINPLDALGVIARYIASTLVCRLVLMYELAGLATVETEDDRV